MLYFDVKHLEKELNRGWRNFWFPFFKKMPILANIGRLDPAHHNIEFYDLLMVCPFDPGYS